MKYKKVISGIFLNRPNRFIANVKIRDKIEVVHVKNTGRCKELLVEGATVYLSEGNNESRKTKYDLIGVIKEKPSSQSVLVNIDSQIVNDVAHEWLLNGNLFSDSAVIRREVTYGDSRFDFYIEDKNTRAFLEVKGVTLENDGIASFPDAPTERGLKHLNELCKCKREGFDAYILFVVQMKGISSFTPNKLLHKEFAEKLKEAHDCGVKIICVDCIVGSDYIVADKAVKIIL